MVTTTCHCKKAKPVPRRCSAKDWSCRLPCGRTLLCGQHACENPCHAGRPTFSNFRAVVVSVVKTHHSFAIPTLNVTLQLHTGDCQPCPRVSKQRCICGRQVAERLCASPQWQCDQVCWCYNFKLISHLFKIWLVGVLKIGKVYSVKKSTVISQL